MIANASTIASAERNDSRTCGRGDCTTVRVPSAIDSYDTDVAEGTAGPSGDTTSGDTTSGEPRLAASIDVDPRSAIPLAIAFAMLAATVWFVRSVPRTITALAIATLLALALNPLVEALQRRTGWQRRYAASLVLVAVSLLFVVAVVLVTVPTIRQAQGIDDDIPEVVARPRATSDRR